MNYRMGNWLSCMTTADDNKFLVHAFVLVLEVLWYICTCYGCSYSSKCVSSINQLGAPTGHSMYPCSSNCVFILFKVCFQSISWLLLQFFKVYIRTVQTSKCVFVQFKVCLHSIIWLQYFNNREGHAYCSDRFEDS